LNFTKRLNVQYIEYNDEFSRDLIKLQFSYNNGKEIIFSELNKLDVRARIVLLLTFQRLTITM